MLYLCPYLMEIQTDQAEAVLKIKEQHRKKLTKSIYNYEGDAIVTASKCAEAIRVRGNE